MTGETANGRSMSVVSSDRPRNLNFAIAHPAHRPKTRFAGTAIAAASRVSFSAAIASASTMAAKYGLEAVGQRLDEHGGQGDG